ncbi:serine/threonine protein kinase [Candidatus Symbiothrix dinenymphae]|nr:serine/threonine protein kinase [Candidatus Symbiothrix dinenymphae]
MQHTENTVFDNRYRLIRLLGRGGFSEVWLVEDTKINAQAALKIYAPGTGLDTDGTALFRQEFALVFNLNHANLLCPTHYDVYENQPYLLMPFCEKGSAKRFVGKITEDQAWHFLHDVAAGLDYLHSQEPPIIHQDIKPDNILLNSKGEFLITDFGISTKARNTLSQSTTDIANAGTLAYMGSERFGKAPRPIKASDIWALGASAFELITGDTPFGEHGGLLLKGGAEVPNIQTPCSEVLKELVYKCLSKETWDRPTAHDIVEMADKWFRGEKLLPAPSRPTTLKTPTTKEPKPEPKKRYGTIWIGLIILGLGGSGIYYYAKQTTLEKARQEQLAREEKARQEQLAQEERAYNYAIKENTIAACDDFLRHYPNSVYKNDIIDRKKQIPIFSYEVDEFLAYEWHAQKKINLFGNSDCSNTVGTITANETFRMVENKLSFYMIPEIRITKIYPNDFPDCPSMFHVGDIIKPLFYVGEGYYHVLHNGQVRYAGFRYDAKDASKVNRSPYDSCNPIEGIVVQSKGNHILIAKIKTSSGRSGWIKIAHNDENYTSDWDKLVHY